MFGTDVNGNPLQLATAVKQVSINDGSGASASLEAKMIALRSDTGNLQLESTVKLDNNGYIAGIGLANSGTTSSFNIRADTFSVISSAANATAMFPFVIDAVTGITHIQGASIQDATITNAQIGSVAADKIIAGTIMAAVRMTAPTITGGNISIGGVGGHFNVSNSGAVSMSSGTTGARLEIKNNVIKVIDANNIVRVQIGNLLV